MRRNSWNMDAKKAEKISKALADPNRLTILKEIKTANNVFIVLT